MELDKEHGPFGPKATYAVGDLCTGCGICAQFCPMNTVSMQ
ncbi:MAG: 4Fe-4S binding protein [Candidatus Aquicultorales bacterium]